MARERFCKQCRHWHRLDAWPRECLPDDERKRSELEAPMFIRDDMEPVQSMLDGKMYDSKSQLRATYKAAGVTEVGNDVPTKPYTPAKVDTKAINESVEKAFQQAGMGA